ncbi:MAG TPA: lysylphosphatidylglycerol synthase transmembrane domain-containing protein [Nevskiaceae bacterium]
MPTRRRAQPEHVPLMRAAARWNPWRHPRLAVVANVVVLAVFGAAVQHYWGWQHLLAPWHRIGAEVAFVGVCGMLVSYTLRALRVYLAEREIPRGQLCASLRLILISNVFNILLPMRSGEASFPILMRRWFGTDLRHGTGTLIWLRVLDLHVLAAIGVACAALGWLGRDQLAMEWIPVLAALCVAAPVAAYLLRRPLARRFERHAGRLARTATEAMGALPTAPGGLVRDLGLTWVAWGVKLASLGYVLARLASLSPALGVLGAIGGDLSTVLPIHAPGGFGTFEAGVLLLLAPARAPTPALLAAAVNLHLLVLATAMGAGGLAWLMPRRRDPAP